MQRYASRRGFLKLWAMLPVPLLSGPALVRAALPDYDELVSPPAPLGRISTWWQQSVRSEPSAQSKRLDTRTYDDVIPLRAMVLGEPPWPSNPVWYLTDGGFIHSGYVQPVRNEPQGDVVTDVAPPGFWARVSVPYVDAFWRPSPEYRARRLYYGTIYRVVGAEQTERGEWWYRLQEGITWSPGPYVPAQSLAALSQEDLAPISPGRIDKWLQIGIAEQSLTCFEGDIPVFHTAVATGVQGKGTPFGEFRVFLKRHVSRMIGDDYDLPGVAFPVYFTYSGVAIHGTYWHNDYGRRHSHGCVNVSNEAAQWIFRWAEPQVPYGAFSRQASADEGTRVVVVPSVQAL